MNASHLNRVQYFTYADLSILLCCDWFGLIDKGEMCIIPTQISWKKCCISFSFQYIKIFAPSKYKEGIFICLFLRI